MARNIVAMGRIQLKWKFSIQTMPIKNFKNQLLCILMTNLIVLCMKTLSEIKFMEQEV